LLGDISGQEMQGLPMRAINFSDTEHAPRTNERVRDRPVLLVSIINYKTAELTLQCLQSVLREIAEIDARVIVVDNCSCDGSAETIAAWISEDAQDDRVQLICSLTNSGFSGGHNQAIAACAADYVLVLNSDAVLRPGCLAALLAAARAQPRAGLIAPRIEYQDGTPQISCFRFHGPSSEFIRGAATGLITRLLHRRDVSLPIPPDPHQIEWASFACILLRGKMVAEIGPMDEGYFLYFEDAEYCLRAYRAGWRVTYVPEARMVHYRGGSAPVKSLARARKRLPRYYYASRTRFLYQAHGIVGLWSSNLAWLLGRSISGARRLLGIGGAPPIEAEAWDIWTNIHKPLGDHCKAD
jgi:hypothetical protein